MAEISLKKSFLKFCEQKKFEQNKNQLEIINSLTGFIKKENNFFNFFLRSKKSFVIIFMEVWELEKQ